MEIQGKIHKILPLQSGQGKNGTWKKQEFILETEGQIQRKICFSLWGDKVDQLSAGPGDLVTVFFDVESREYNDRWYTDAKAWKITGSEAKGPAKSSSIPASDDISGPEDDLPF
ncbi:MAG: DUF3127 domain-containing protein [Syntrophothermus sp.]